MVTLQRNLQPFHLAFPVHDLNQTEEFYVQVLGCATGRRSTQWIDFDFFGHQLVAHQVDSGSNKGKQHNQVDGHDVPVPHFGVVLTWGAWHDLKEQLKQRQVEFVIEPYIRFAGEPGEQATMFLLDPSGNALEFKAFKNENNLFASD